MANALVEPTEAQWVVKGSKFIAYAAPLSEPKSTSMGKGSPEAGAATQLPFPEPPG